MKNYENNTQSVQCVDGADKTRNCSIIFNDSFKLEYSFIDGDEHTMYPVKILSFHKQEVDVWKLKDQLIFTNFRPSFDGETIIDTNLPIGYGCKRVNGEKYPNIQTNYGSRFELVQEVVLNYKSRTSSWPSERNTRRTYSNRMYVDDTINVANTIDEHTNASIRRIYDTKSHLLHNMHLDNQKCVTSNFTKRSLNWFYIQDSFLRKPELYYAKTNYLESNFGNYSFLGEYNIGPLHESYLVFENLFDYYATQIHNKEENNSNKSNHQTNVNPNLVISTHYYSKSDWSCDSNKLLVPKKIELRLNRYAKQIGNLTINLKSVDFSPKQSEKYTMTDCIQIK